ncbi:MAG TPA: hypothetical protein VI588_01225, partial [Candidatus Gracilibacteria bacterium]|nr:hypothetical protein [Candidatus Gracilibacteria bacterium]
MKLPFFGQKNDKSQAAEDLQDGIATEAVEDTEVVDTGTKIKVVAALLVVAFATYIAYWVQEPSDIKVDVLADSQETGDSM